MTRKINSYLPWSSLVEASRTKEAPWKDITSSILTSIQKLNLTETDLGSGEALPLDTLEMVKRSLDEHLEIFDKMSYYVKLDVRFKIYQTLVGLLLHQIVSDERSKNEVQTLMLLTHLIILRSTQQPPFTIELWKEIGTLLEEEVRATFSEIVSLVEDSIITLTGNSIYTYFEDRCSRKEIDMLLRKAYNDIEAEEAARRYTVRHDEGHSKLILQHIYKWQNDYQMRMCTRIYPFIRCLSAHWRHRFNLGCRQGLEKAYKPEF